jgi:NitT/TauT family transport system permease protein
VKRIALRFLSLLICLLLWHLASSNQVDLGFVSFKQLPSPEQVSSEALDLIHSKKFLAHLNASILRVLSGFCLATVVGISLGLSIGRFAWASNFLLPPLEMLRPIPAVAWIPLAILMFPSSEVSMIFITFTGALFPILLNTIHGVEAIDQRLIAAARSLGCKRGTLFYEIIIPAAASNIFTGLAIGMGTAWFCLVSAEMIAGQFGLGYYTWSSYTIQNYPAIVVGMLLIGLLGMASSLLIRYVARLVMPWQTLVVKRNG